MMRFRDDHSCRPSVATCAGSQGPEMLDSERTVPSPSELFARTTITMMQTVVSSVWVIGARQFSKSFMCSS